MASTQQEAIDWLKLNFGKVRDDALFTSLKDITNSSYYQSATESANYIMIPNCSSLITTLGITIGITGSGITDQMDNTINYTVTVVAPDSSTLIVGVSGGSGSISVKSFLTALDHNAGLENFQFRCIDQRDNNLHFRMGRFPSNFNILFPAGTYKVEIRPIFCDNIGMFNRNHCGTTYGTEKHKIRSRIMEEYGRGGDDGITLPLYLNSALSDNVIYDPGSSNPPTESNASMQNQINATLQANYVNRDHTLKSNPIMLSGYGKAKILNDFHGSNFMFHNEPSGNYDFYGGTGIMPECGIMGPKNARGSQEMDTVNFRAFAGSISSFRPYRYGVDPVKITHHTSDTPAGDSSFTICEFNLSHFCMHKRIRMGSHRHLGKYGRNNVNPLYHSYSRVQYTMALVIGNYNQSHGKPCAIIPDQGRFYDFEETITTTKSKICPLVKGYVSRTRTSTVDGIPNQTYFAPTALNTIQFGSSLPTNGNRFLGMHIGTETGLYGFLKKISLSGNTLIVGGQIFGLEGEGMSGDSDRTTVQLTINLSQLSSKTISVSQGTYVLVGATVYFLG